MEKIRTNIYEIKIGRTWTKVRATNMRALSDWADKNNVSDWRVAGMMSRKELEESQTLKIVG